MRADSPKLAHSTYTIVDGCKKRTLNLASSISRRLARERLRNHRTPPTPTARHVLVRAGVNKLTLFAYCLFTALINHLPETLI